MGLHPRPARSLATAAAAVTVTFAAGPALSLGAMQSHRLLDSTAPLVVAQAVVTRRFLDAAGIGLGDRLTLTGAGRRTTVRVVGEAFFTENDGMTVLTRPAP